MDDADAAAELRRRHALRPARTRSRLREGEYLDADLVGCAVVGIDGTEHGMVERVEHYPSSDMLVVAGRMVPMVRAIVTAIDLAARGDRDRSAGRIVRLAVVGMRGRVGGDRGVDGRFDRRALSGLVIERCAEARVDVQLEGEQSSCYGRPAACANVPVAIVLLRLAPQMASADCATLVVTAVIWVLKRVVSAK